MSRSLLLPAAALGLVLSQAPAHAQALNGVTQYPPAPNAASQAPQPLNSVPRGGVTGATVAPGASLGGSTPVSPGPAVTPPPPAVNSLHPLRPPRRVVRHPIRRFFHRPAPAPAPVPVQQ